MKVKARTFEVKIRTVRRSAGRLFRELQANQYLAPERLRELVDKRSSGIALFAAQHTEFYARHFAEHGITEAKLRDPEAWANVPTIQRDLVKAHAAQFASSQANARNSRLVLTGGSTGEPLQLMHDARVPTLALSWRMYRWWGIEPWDDLARMGRWSFGRWSGLKNSVAWWPTKQIYSDAALMDPESMRKVVAAITSVRPALIEGYVGTLLELADYLQKNGVRIPPPTGAATTSAPLTEAVRAQLQEAIGAPVYDEYRGAEAGWVAGECKEQNGLHVFTDMRRVEVVDDDGQPLPPGETGDILVTDLSNRVFPLIRYRIGDRGSLKEGPCPCGVTLPLMAKPEGRLTDVLRLPSGKVLNHRLDTMFAAHPKAVKLFQIHQHADHAITIRVVATDAADSRLHIEQEVQELRSRTNNEVPVAIEYVTSLSYPRGKIKYVISDVVT